MLISRDDLKYLLVRLDRFISEPVDLVLVGGSAVLVLCPRAVATKDLDAFPTDSLHHLSEALRSFRTKGEAIDLNTASTAFETYLPDDWQSRIKISAEFSIGNIRVFTPVAEDLAVMKVFRYVAKDAEDIVRLADLEIFRSEDFRLRFLQVLPVAIGDTRRHAQSFCLAWNALYPDQEIEIDEVLKAATI